MLGQGLEYEAQTGFLSQSYNFLRLFRNLYCQNLTVLLQKMEYFFFKAFSQNFQVVNFLEKI